MRLLIRSRNSFLLAVFSLTSFITNVVRPLIDQVVRKSFCLPVSCYDDLCVWKHLVHVPEINSIYQFDVIIHYTKYECQIRVIRQEAADMSKGNEGEERIKGEQQQKELS